MLYRFTDRFDSITVILFEKHSHAINIILIKSCDSSGHMIMACSSFLLFSFCSRVVRIIAKSFYCSSKKMVKKSDVICTTLKPIGLTISDHKLCIGTCSL